MFYEAEGKNYEKLTNSRLRNLFYDNPQALSLYNNLFIEENGDSFLDAEKILEVIDVYNGK